MSTYASADFFIRFVDEKHNDLKLSLKNLVNSLVRENKDSKQTNVASTLSKATLLKESMSKADVPDWLTQLIYHLNRAGGNQDSNFQDMVAFLLKNSNSIEEHRWSFENSDSSFDFDSIYEKYRSQSRLDELFLEVVKVLEKMRDSDEIDSVKMLSALEKVINTLKSNSNSSFFSVRSAWEFFKIFFKNYLFIQLGEISNLSGLFEALNETIKETDKEMHDLSENVHSEMKNLVESEVQALDGKAEFTFLGYNNSGQLENKSDSKKLGTA
jgi:hypothetical protein